MVDFVSDDHDNEVQAMYKKLEYEDQQKVDTYRRHAATLVSTHVKLLVEPTSEAALAASIRGSAAGQVRGDYEKGKYVGIIYDVKVCGETITAPMHRIPSYRSNHHNKLSHAMCHPVELGAIQF